MLKHKYVFPGEPCEVGTISHHSPRSLKRLRNLLMSFCLWVTEHMTTIITFLTTPPASQPGAPRGCYTCGKQSSLVQSVQGREGKRDKTICCLQRQNYPLDAILASNKVTQCSQFWSACPRLTFESSWQQLIQLQNNRRLFRQLWVQHSRPLHILETSWPLDGTEAQMSQNWNPSPAIF